MIVLYNLILFLLFPLYFVIFLPLSLIKKKWRKGFFRKLGFYRYGETDKNYIFHCVSVGESLATIPLIKKFITEISEKVVVTVTTATGFKVSSEKIGDTVRSVTFFPFDFPFSVYAFIRTYRPAAFIISETEIWPNIIFFSRMLKIPVIFVNGRISDRSFKRYKRLRFFLTSFLDYPYFIMQNSLYKERILKMGADKNKVFTSGNIKYDMSEKQPLNRTDFGINEMDIVIIAGSTHPKEEKIVINCFKKLRERYDNLKLILAPRHPERFREVEGLIKDSGFNPVKRSEGNPVADVFLLDTVGELFSFYSLADIAFVGGSLVNIGGHNILEPAYFSKPVLFGRYMSNFSEIRERFLERQAGIEVDEESLYDQLLKLVENRELRETLGIRGREVVEENKGSIKKTLDIIKEIIEEKR